MINLVVFAAKKDIALFQKKLSVTVTESIPLFNHKNIYADTRIKEGKLTYSIDDIFSGSGRTLSFEGYEYDPEDTSNAPGCHILVNVIEFLGENTPLLKDGLILKKGQTFSDFSYVGGTTWFSQRQITSKLFRNLD